MHGRYLFYIGLLTVWLLIGNHQTVASPSYQFRSTSSSLSSPEGRSGGVSTSYQFRSTSSYAPSGRVQVYSVGAASPSVSPRRNDGSSWDWSDPGAYDPIGQTPDPTPVGEPYILLLFAAIYALYATLRQQRRLS